MNLLQYELFASVSRTLNISKTAQQYFITQPAVSHHLKSLEESLGVELIKRTKHGVYLTEAGQDFLPYVQEILALNDRAETRMRSIADGMVGRIRIAALSSASYLLSECLVEFYSAHPGIQVDITLVDGAEMVEMLRQDGHDFFFAIPAMVPDNMGYDKFIIERGSLSLFVTRKLAGGMPDGINWEIISQQPFISVPKSDISLSGKMLAICRGHGFEPHVINIYNRAESVMLSVDSGLGVAILPGALGQIYQRPNVVQYPLNEPDAASNTACVWCPHKLTGAGQTFLEVVRKLHAQD